MPRLARSVLLLAAALCAGCGSSNSSSSGPSSSAGSSGSSGGAQVTMRNIAFSPKEMTVKVGQKVTWTNEDGVDHNVTARSGASFRSQNFGKGGTYSFTPEKKGKIKYVCTIHPGMDGVIIVR